MTARTARQRQEVSKVAKSWALSQIGPFLVFCLIGAGILYSLDRRAPVELGSPAVNPSSVPAGGIVTLDWTQDWKRLCPGQVTRDITTEHGELKIFKPFDIQPPDKTGIVEHQSKVYVPKTTPAGVVTMTSTIAFRCNFLQDYWPIIVKSKPVKITVSSVN